MTDIATDTILTSNKRTRLHSSSGIKSTPSPSSTVAQKQLVANFIRGYLALLPPNKVPILERTPTKYTDILIKAYKKSQQIDQMESDGNYIPKSARINFEFVMTKAAKLRPKLTELQEETEKHFVDFPQVLKE